MQTRLRRIALDKFGRRCAFPDCSEELHEGRGLHFAHIVAARPGSPRHDPTYDESDINDVSNLLVLCPNHHWLIDNKCEDFPIETLRAMQIEGTRASEGRPGARAESSISVDTGIFHMKVSPETSEPSSAQNSLQDALGVWEAEKGNSSEEFWQQFFTARPEVLGSLFCHRPFVLNSKCYVGGKTILNTGGGVVDFVLQHAGDVTVLEIKTPTEDLVGKKYRQNVFAPSHDLSGAIVQVLNYQLSLIKNIYALQGESDALQVHSPQAVVIMGDLQRETLSDHQMKSLQLFRTGLKNVTVYTYDEVFGGIRELLKVLEGSGHKDQPGFQ